MLKSYEKWNICMAFAACLAIAIMIVLLAFDCAITIQIVYAAVVFAVFFGLASVLSLENIFVTLLPISAALIAFFIGYSFSKKKKVEDHVLLQ